MAQPVRFATLEKFKAGEIRLLVCSDVAARGLDIGGLSHVFNFDVPHHAEDYVHRIGRTGRAGREGRAFTLATPADQLAVEAIEKLTGHAIPRIEVEGLDPVDWAADDGRAARPPRPWRAARALTPAARAPGTSARPRAQSGPDERPVAERAPRAARRAPAGAPRAAAAPAPRPAAPRVRNRAPTARSRSPREPAKPVVGFGADVPAFMRIAARGAGPLEGES